MTDTNMPDEIWAIDNADRSVPEIWSKEDVWVNGTKYIRADLYTQSAVDVEGLKKQCLDIVDYPEGRIQIKVVTKIINFLNKQGYIRRPEPTTDEVKNTHNIVRVDSMDDGLDKSILDALHKVQDRDLSTSIHIRQQDDEKRVMKLMAESLEWCRDIASNTGLPMTIEICEEALAEYEKLEGGE